MDTRCEGYRRCGGAFTLGPVRWEQCKNTAITILKVKQEKIETIPSCLECWGEARTNGIKILSAEPLAAEGEPLIDAYLQTIADETEEYVKN